MNDSPLICPQCHGALARAGNEIECTSCGRRYPVAHGIIDFAPNGHYDHFSSEEELTPDHRRGLELEVEGSRRRIADFYLPLLRKHQPAARRVLDTGCGNGVSVETLAQHGYDAWGNDLSELRAWQWRQRTLPERLLVANALTLPFADGYFDAVISSGVIEHIGVAETSVPVYAVRALPDRDAQRLAFVRELARVVRPGGSIYIDAPNGGFPIDFWHSDAAGKPRFHSLRENFLPRYREIRTLAKTAMPRCRVAPVSPHKRLQFRQAGRHLHGKLLAPAADVLFRAMTVPGLRWLAGTAINPFLVVRIAKL